MTKQTHTPGPWAYQGLAGDHEYAIYDEVTGRDLALVRDFHTANARLIAEAPAMVEALRGIVGTAEPHVDFIIAINEARSILARIDGEDQA